MIPHYENVLSLLRLLWKLWDVRISCVLFFCLRLGKPGESTDPRKQHGDSKGSCRGNIALKNEIFQESFGRKLKILSLITKIVLSKTLGCL